MRFKIFSFTVFSLYMCYAYSQEYRPLKKARSGMNVYLLRPDKKYQQVKISSVVTGTNMVGIYTARNRGILVCKSNLFEKKQLDDDSENKD